MSASSTRDMCFMVSEKDCFFQWRRRALRRLWGRCCRFLLQNLLAALWCCFYLDLVTVFQAR